MTYEAARDALVGELRADAAAHRKECYDAIGRRFDRLEYEFPRGTEPQLAKLQIALAFWDGWVDARNNGWPSGPIALDQWAPLAEQVADDLAHDREITAPLVLARFDLIAHPRLNERVQTLAARLRGRDADAGSSAERAGSSAFTG